MSDFEQLEQYFNCAKELTLEAGKLIFEGINQDKEVSFKTSEGDLVTKYDQLVEKLLIGGLKKEFPDHKFIGEETSAAEKSVPELGDDPTWIIDPIDGTINFVHGYPQTCISVALTIKKKLQIGIIYNPSYNELYTAIKGQGTCLNGKPVKTSHIKTMNKAVMSSEPSVRPLLPADKEIALARAEILCLKAQGVRNNGSAALLLAYVARGILDGFQCIGLQIWDIAAGIILIEEAGGCIFGSKGGPFDLSKTGLIAAANTHLAAEFCKLMIEIDLKTQRNRLKRA